MTRLFLPWISVLANIILTSVMGFLCRRAIDAIAAQKRRLKEEETMLEARMKAQNDALLALLRDRLFQACFSGLKAGCLTTQEHENISGMHEAYKILRGNHAGDTLARQALSLPLVEKHEEGTDGAYNTDLKAHPVGGE